MRVGVRVMNAFLRSFQMVLLVFIIALAALPAGAQQGRADIPAQPRSDIAQGQASCVSCPPPDAGLLDHPLFVPVTVAASTAALLLASLSILLRRRLADLSDAITANQMLVETLEGAQTTIAIFDQQLELVQGNNGDKGGFRTLVNHIAKSAEVTQFHKGDSPVENLMQGIAQGDTEALAQRIKERLRSGHSLHQLVHHGDGKVFDLRLFPIGQGHFASLQAETTKAFEDQTRVAAQQSDLKQKNSDLLSFSSIAAHDLRGPLLKQKALLDFIVEDMREAGITLPQETIKHLALLGDLTRDMSTLITDLLNFARAEGASCDPQIVLPDQRIKDIAPLASFRNGFSVQVLGVIPHVWANPTVFDMVMRNLISNAIKHHDKNNGNVLIRGYAKGDETVIEVEDDGPGIPENCVATVFEPFTKLSKSDSSGLGLSFVRNSVAAWGGQITVDRATPRGSIFRLTFPQPRSSMISGPSWVAS